MRKTGTVLLILAAVFATAETLYFGGNWLPSCPAESVCDNIALTMTIVGMVLFTGGRR